MFGSSPTASLEFQTFRSEIIIIQRILNVADVLWKLKYGVISLVISTTHSGRSVGRIRTLQL